MRFTVTQTGLISETEYSTTPASNGVFPITKTSMKEQKRDLLTIEADFYDVKEECSYHVIDFGKLTGKRIGFKDEYVKVGRVKVSGEYTISSESSNANT